MILDDVEFRAGLLVTLSLFLSLKLSADTIELKSGERIEGTFKQATSAGPVIEVGGQSITIPLGRLQAIYFGATVRAFVGPADSQGVFGASNPTASAPTEGRPPKFSPRQFVPPAQVANNPKLLIDPALIGPLDPTVPNNITPDWGDPLATLGPASNGPVDGGTSPGVYRVGAGVSAPAVLYKIDPEYTEDAREAKYSGTVVLYIEVDPSGHAKNMRLVKGIGHGLDEKAIEAVNKWRFRPGMKDGKPVVVAAHIEVNFRLLVNPNVPPK
jgi:TonB family protein